MSSPRIESRGLRPGPNGRLHTYRRQEEGPAGTRAIRGSISMATEAEGFKSSQTTEAEEQRRRPLTLE